MTKRILFIILILMLGISGCSTRYVATDSKVQTEEQPVDLDQLLLQVESSLFQRRLLRGNLYATHLAVSASDVSHSDFSLQDTTMSGGVFDVMASEVTFAHNLHERLYPASTTKIVTAYVALLHGNLSDVVTFDERAFNLRWDAARGGFAVGDQATLYDLLICLMLSSSNDAAIAIATHIAGSEEAFTELMNQELRALGATNSHYVNSHGLHDPNQYTTVYDLYLVFYAAIQDPIFLDLLQYASHEITLQRAEGPITLTFRPTSWYVDGRTQAPEGIRVFGGKTGTTRQAGRCLVLLVYDAQERPYVSMIMGAESADELYDTLNLMFEKVLR